MVLTAAFTPDRLRLRNVSTLGRSRSSPHVLAHVGSSRVPAIEALRKHIAAGDTSTRSFWWTGQT